MKHCVYMLRCSDGTFYTGYSTDIERRVAEHNQGARGARYTRGRRPVVLVYRECFSTRGLAQQREAHIKQLSRAQKSALIGQPLLEKIHGSLRPLFRASHRLRHRVG